MDKREQKKDACDDYLGHEPGKTGWSRHICQESYTSLDKDGSVLCHVRLSRGRGGWLIRGLYPVMISRDLFQCPPRELLDESLWPATAITDLSPADRVFGWVHPDAGSFTGNGPTAWRGHLRVGPVQCPEGVDAIESLSGPGKGMPDGVPLAILGEPKPQQVRFYVGGDAAGSPLADGTRKADGYSKVQGQGLRGRKVYPHHRHLSDWSEYWDNPGEDRTDRAQAHGRRRYHQEYRRPEHRSGDGKDQTRDDQNRTITEWIKAGVSFRCNLEITNLAEVELGALLWLLTLDDDLYLRLGGGKPLGFGSVRLRLTDLDLRDGIACRADYSYLLDRGSSSAADGDAGEERIVERESPRLFECIRAYQQAAIEAYHTAAKDAYKQAAKDADQTAKFKEISFIKAFLTASGGFTDDLPIHYPRIDRAQNPEGKNFLWFTANDSRFGLCLTLPALHLGDPGLPLDPKGD